MIAVVVGTRPECLKMAPVIRALRAQETPHKVIAIEQHEDLLKKHLLEAEIVPDMTISGLGRCGPAVRRDLSLLLADILQGLQGDWFCRERFALVLVQGDTTTALAAALAAHHRRIPVGHVEAGLRTFRDTPFPEEMNRKIIGQIAKFHFCPTEQAQNHMLQVAQERCRQIYVTGNTSVDQLLHDLARNSAGPLFEKVKPLGPLSVLVTMHRRENVENGNIPKIASALASLAPEHQIVWSLHPNPLIAQQLSPPIFSNDGRIQFVSALSHAQFVAKLNTAAVVVTDSGGVVEEAATLGKPVLVVRDETERPEAVHDGFAEMVSQAEVPELAARVRHALQRDVPPPCATFGTGNAGSRIAELSRDFVGQLRR